MGHTSEFHWHCGGTLAALSWHCGGTLAALWRHSRGTVAALSRHCGGTLVALWRHSHAALSWHPRGTLLALSWHSRGTVMALSCLPPALLAISRLRSGGFLSTSSSKMKTFSFLGIICKCDLEKVWKLGTSHFRFSPTSSSPVPARHQVV